MLFFDIGANKGDATFEALRLGIGRIIAVEAAPRIFKELAIKTIYSNQITPLKYAVASKDNEIVTFYEATEDGLSTLNVDWLTAEGMPYKGKEYREVKVNTITLDTLIAKYGMPDLTKIDVEGAEWEVFHGLTQYANTIAFEWTDVTLAEHQKQLQYLKGLGYTKYALQYIQPHLLAPKEYRDIDYPIADWVKETEVHWVTTGWREFGLRPTADVGMLWVI
jgi:FkbM family methyltransferase